jgi:hypothetical protein
MELLYHVPLSLWAVWGLLRGECPPSLVSPFSIPLLSRMGRRYLGGEPHLPCWVGFYVYVFERIED